MKGDYFGGRALLIQEDFEDDETDLVRKIIELGPAKVSVVIISKYFQKVILIDC